MLYYADQHILRASKQTVQYENGAPYLCQHRREVKSRHCAPLVQGYPALPKHQWLLPTCLLAQRGVIGGQLGTKHQKAGSRQAYQGVVLPELTTGLSHVHTG